MSGLGPEGHIKALEADKTGSKGPSWQALQAPCAAQCMLQMAHMRLPIDESKEAPPTFFAH